METFGQPLIAHLTKCVMFPPKKSGKSCKATILWIGWIPEHFLISYVLMPNDFRNFCGPQRQPQSWEP